LGNWTASPLDAFDFQHSQRAIDFARQHGLSAVQIAVKFVDSECDEVFPIPVAATAATFQQARA
jgi:aryl-alcohol dehydrogenase-like predicted oxidoreductase